MVGLPGGLWRWFRSTAPLVALPRSPAGTGTPYHSYREKEREGERTDKVTFNWVPGIAMQCTDINVYVLAMKLSLV